MSRIRPSLLRGTHKHFTSRHSKRCLSTSSSSPAHTSHTENRLPKEADVVIIGGGSLGCNTLYHLTKLGINNVVLLEKDKLTAGTTWHTAGLLWRLRPNDTDIQLIGRTHELLQGLEEETGINPGWINNGGLFIAKNRERLDEYKRLHTLGKSFGIESYLLDQEETRALYPAMNVDDIYGTLYSPADGTMDPNGLCAGLARAATRAGAKVVEGCSVTSIATGEELMGAQRVEAVETNLGTVRTRNVVNCTGAWANYITSMVGLEIPLVAMHHSYVTTESVPEIVGMPNVRDHDASVYLKVQGDSLHIGGYENNPVFWEKVEKDFAFGLFELDYDVFAPHIAGAVHRVPRVASAGIKSTVCGPESFTPDHKPVMGEDWRVRGFFHGCGFNSSGMMLGGGCGQQLAEWVAKGRPILDMYGYDVRRFCPKVSRDGTWVRERSHEAYAKNYATVFPHDEPLAGRSWSKKDPLYDEMVAAGCVFQERNGWERPGWFSPDSAAWGTSASPLSYDWYGAYGHQSHSRHAYRDRLEMDYTFEHPQMLDVIRDECLSARTKAALFNMSYFGKFYLAGEGAQEAADWIFSNRMDMEGGRTVYTCMLNARGKIEADLTVSAVDEGDRQGLGVDDQSLCPEKGRSFYIAAAGGSASHALAHLITAVQDKGIGNVSITDCSTEMGLLSLQGPRSREILTSLAPDTEWSNQAFPFSTHKLVKIAGRTVRAMRVSFVGELGWELHVPAASCSPVYAAVMANGVCHVSNAGYRAMDALSIEKGYPHWHQEIRMDDSPLECGLAFTCKLKTDTDFLGRAEVEKAKVAGTDRRKVCLTVENREVCLLGLETIYRDGVLCGHVRRAGDAFHLDKSVAYGYVITPSGQKITKSWLESGSYEIECKGERIPARLHTKTPFDPLNKRLQGDYTEDLVPSSISASNGYASKMAVREMHTMSAGKDFVGNK